MGTTTSKLGLFKPDPDPVTGDDVDVDDINDNSDKIDAAAGLTICTSSTRPSSPWDGQPIYETDTNRVMHWVEGAWFNPALCSYPVGAIYQSTVSTSPATLFGGTWAALTDRFLIGASATYPAGTTGGAATKTLATGELPSHNHSDGTLAAASDGAHTHSFGTVLSSSMPLHSGGGVSGWTGDNIGTSSMTTDSGGAHTHDVTGSTGNTGSGTAFSILPPHRAVYMWERTA